jgi:putative endonuclease
MEYFVYILTNKSNKVLYTGFTNNLSRRTFEHIYKLDKSGFAERYNCNKLVYFESTTDVKVAIEREKQIKGFTRFKKIKLIEEFNPEWNDLFEKRC